MRAPLPDDAATLDAAVRSLANVLVTASEAEDRMTWARRIHDGCGRRGGRFVGVFSGQKQRVRADDIDDCFARATGGTLFFDRVGDLSSEAQERLSRQLAEQSRHANGSTTLPAGTRVRVVAGSDRPLGADLAIGAFSDELFYRLNVIHIDLMHQDESGEQSP